MEAMADGRIEASEMQAQEARLTRLMKEIGHGEGYAYDHDAPDGLSGAYYWPDGMEPQTYYTPVPRGFERQIIERIEWWEKKRRELREP